MWWLWTIIFSSLYIRKTPIRARLLEVEQGCSNLRPSTRLRDNIQTSQDFSQGNLSWALARLGPCGRSLQDPDPRGRRQADRSQRQALRSGSRALQLTGQAGRPPRRHSTGTWAPAGRAQPGSLLCPGRVGHPQKDD